MSLFPAYSDGTSEHQQKNGTGARSVSQSEKVVEHKVSGLFDGAKSFKSSELQTSKSRNSYRSINPEIPLTGTGERSESLYIEDRRRETSNFLIPTLMKNDPPVYDLPKTTPKSPEYPLPKKATQWRYYKSEGISIKGSNVYVPPLKNRRLSTESIISVNQLERSRTWLSLPTFEDELTSLTADFNRKLNEEPNNIELWIKYVDFQDEKNLFEQHHKKSRKRSIPLLEKKLSVLSRALSLNPKSEKLLNMKYDLLEEIGDFQATSSELMNDLKKWPSSLLLWLRYIRHKQYSMSTCATTDILSSYKEAIDKIAQNKDANTERGLLRLFVECGLYLRQAGLWEQLCALIRLYLQINLTKSSNIQNFNFLVGVPHEDYIAEEEKILQSGLPVCAMWARIEILRQRVHWYPVTEDESSDDPQRIVFPSDVSDLLRPISSSALELDLIGASLCLLKVPLLPMRDSCVRLLQWSELKSSMDSAESFLAMYHSVGVVDLKATSENSIISCATELIAEPQYVANNVGQYEYQEFISHMFRAVSSSQGCLEETAILVWWLRFERLLVKLKAQSHRRKDKLKPAIKELLNQQKHSNNIALYVEYALLDKEISGNGKGCLKILSTTLSVLPKNKPLPQLGDAKNNIAAAYRVYCELLISANEMDKCLSLLVSLALSVGCDTTLSLSKFDPRVTESDRVFRKVADSCLKNVPVSKPASFLDLLTNHFVAEWIACYAWFLVLSKSVWAAVTYLEGVIAKLCAPSDDEDYVTMGAHLRELFSEQLISVLYHHCVRTRSSFGALKNHCYSCVKRYPNNAYFLSVISSLEMKSCGVSSWWELDRHLSSTHSELALVTLVFIARWRFKICEKAHVQAYLPLGLDEITDYNSSSKNRMKSLLSKLCGWEEGKRCPLLWRVYLQFASCYETPEQAKQLFYLAAEQCPWIKVNYLEASRLVPSEFARIQDLILEKELRLHITSEEIDILRT